MDLKQLFDDARAPSKALNYDDYIEPFYIKNSCKGNLIQLKTSVIPYENESYLLKLLQVKQEDEQLPEDLSVSGCKQEIEKPFKCTSCYYTFKSRHNLMMHRKTHMLDKQYSCNVCGYRAVLSSTIKKHMIVHSSSDKQYKCTWCKFQTMYKHSLEFHIKRHTGEKPYQCLICDYRTIQKANLAFHMRHHSGTNSLNCSSCDFTATSKSLLDEHHLQKHVELSQV